MDQDQKRELRQLKREIKRAGGKRRRRQLKQGLAEHPEDAHQDSASFGRYRSADLNGIDRDSTRRPSDGQVEPHRGATEPRSLSPEVDG